MEISLKSYVRFSSEFYDNFFSIFNLLTTINANFIHVRINNMRRFIKEFRENNNIRKEVWMLVEIRFCSESIQDTQIVFYLATFTGITNHEEYSLVRELPDEEKEKTLTLRRDRSIAKDQKKLDELKKKLHTDDEREFLNFEYLFKLWDEH